MTTVVTATDFGERDDVPDWRYLLSTLRATFRAGSFESAAGLVTGIAAAAEAAEHHPDINVRYPDRVHVMLTTHGAGGVVTDLDVALARTISELAAAAGAHPEPTSSQVIELALDVMDVDLVRPFWAAVLAYRDRPADSSGTVTALFDPAGAGPSLWFQQMDAPRTERNRFHLDVEVPPEIADARIAETIAAGGTLVTDRFAPSWWVLADPEGNEACICTCLGRDGAD